MAIFNKTVAGKLSAYFQHKLGMFVYRNGWLKGDCPNCGKEKKFGINIGLNRSNCFSCGENIKPLELLKKTEGFERTSQLWPFLRGLTDIDPYYESSSIVSNKEETQVKAQLPESFTFIDLGDSELARLARKYMKSRGFSISRLADKGVGYCTSGEYGGCIILPTYVRGELVYYTGRRFINLGEKFKNPKVEDFNVGKAQILHNIEALGLYRKVYIVESYLNAETLGDNAVAQFGKDASAWQKTQYISSKASEFVIMLDPDALEQAYRLAYTLSSFKKVKVVIFPDGEDVNDLGKVKSKELEKSSKWLTTGDCLRGINYEKARLQYESQY